MLLLLGVAYAQPCATMQVLPGAGPVRSGRIAAAGPASIRDIYGVPNVVTTEHFAGWWGGTGGLAAEDVHQLLSEFELAWAVEVDQLGHPPPYGTDAFLFNVYV